MDDQTLRSAGPPTIWDNTMRSTLMECPRKLYYFLRRFEFALGDRPAYFTYGTAFHDGLRFWYLSPATEPGTSAHQMRMAGAISTALESWDNEAPVEKPPLNTRANLKLKLERYFMEYPSEPWTFVPMGGEVGWIWPLNANYELGGALDGYANWPNYGLFVLENKTSGDYLGSNYLDQYQYSTQCTGYVWYLSQLVPPGEAYGILLNAVTKNTPGPKSKWTTKEFERVSIRKHAWQLEQFQEDFIRDLNYFEHVWDQWHWPQHGFLHPTTCSGGAGKSPCLYRPICKSGLRIQDVDPKRFPFIQEVTTLWEPWKRKDDSE